MKKRNWTRIIATVLTIVMAISVMPLTAFALVEESFDTSVTGEYFSVVSEKILFVSLCAR